MNKEIPLPIWPCVINEFGSDSLSRISDNEEMHSEPHFCRRYDPRDCLIDSKGNLFRIYYGGEKKRLFFTILGTCSYEWSGDSISPEAFREKILRHLSLYKKDSEEYLKYVNNSHKDDLIYDSRVIL